MNSIASFHVNLLDEMMNRFGSPAEGGTLERQDVRPRHVTHVDVQRRSAKRGIVPVDGTARCASDEPVDKLVRARCGRVIDLA